MLALGDQDVVSSNMDHDPHRGLHTDREHDRTPFQRPVDHNPQSSIELLFVWFHQA
jgi:hypothetical protein